MTREEREKELYGLMRANGLGPILKAYQKAMDIPFGTMLPPGLTGLFMIEKILEQEYASDE
jgi:hypothetical protein